MRLHGKFHRGHMGDGHGRFVGRQSRVYDFVATRVLRRAYRRLARDLATLAKEGSAVLDIGTGPGVLLLELARLRPDLRLTGVDPSPDMVAAAQRKLARYAPRATVVTGDSADLPFEDGSFDLIVSSLSLHHWERPAQASTELARVLRADGVVCVYDFPSAPFDELTGSGRDVRRSVVPVGIPFFPPLTRVVYATG